MSEHSIYDKFGNLVGKIRDAEPDVPSILGGIFGVAIALVVIFAAFAVPYLVWAEAVRQLQSGDPSFLLVGITACIAIVVRAIQIIQEKAKVRYGPWRSLFFWGTIASFAFLAVYDLISGESLLEIVKVSPLALLFAGLFSIIPACIGIIVIKIAEYIKGKRKK